MPLFHVETKRSDGAWATLTVNPIFGQEAAQKHLDSVKRDIANLSPEDVRLRELTVEDCLHLLTNEEKFKLLLEHVEDVGAEAAWAQLKDSIVLSHIKKMGPDRFWHYITDSGDDE